MLEAVLAGLFGLLIGSFLNVCIYRFPRDLSVVRPRSFCPECEMTIAWYDNVPLLSYALLKGKCRNCSAPILARYPLVEASTGFLFFSFIGALGVSWVAFKFCLLSALLVGMIFADFEERILPDEFTIGGILAGLALSWVIPVVQFSDNIAAMLASIARIPLHGNAASFVEAIFGAAIPSGFLWIVGETFQKVRHKEGLGFGDVKMIAAIGAFMGLQAALFTMIAGSAAGAVLGLIFIAVTKRDYSSYELPFGSFLGIAAIVAAFLVQHVFGWYAKLL
jgi:leader peptidase (prepilin peptidase) / N-methyltransferase